MTGDSTSTTTRVARTTPPRFMRAVVLTGHGGLDRLSFRKDVPVPGPAPGRVLVAARACGLDNTDVKLHDLVAAQEAFIAKRHVGNIAITMTAHP